MGGRFPCCIYIIMSYYTVLLSYVNGLRYGFRTLVRIEPNVRYLIFKNLGLMDMDRKLDRGSRIWHINLKNVILYISSISSTFLKTASSTNKTNTYYTCQICSIN